MIEAFLPIEKMPENCFECDFLDTYDKDGIQTEEHFCGVPGIGEDVEDYEACRPDFCPIKKMLLPESCEEPDNWEMAHRSGWNDCLRELGAY